MSLESLLDSPDSEWRDVSDEFKKFLNRTRKQAAKKISSEEAKQYLKQEKERLNNEIGRRIFTNELPDKKKFNKRIKHHLNNGNLNDVIESYEKLKKIEEGDFSYHPKFQEEFISKLEKLLTEERMENINVSFKKKTVIRDEVLLSYVQERAKQILLEGGIIKHNLYTISESLKTGEVKTKLALTQDTVRSNVLAPEEEIKNLYMTEKDIDTMRRGFSLKYKFQDHKADEVDLMAAVNYFTFEDKEGKPLWIIKSRIKRNEDNMLKHIHYWLGIRDNNFYDTTGTIELANNFKTLYEHIPLVAKKSHNGIPEIIKFTPNDIPREYDEDKIKLIIDRAESLHDSYLRTGEKPKKDHVKKMLMQIQVKKFYHNIKMENNLQVMDLHNEIYLGRVIGHDKYFFENRRKERHQNEINNNLNEVTTYLRDKLAPVFKNV